MAQLILGVNAGPHDASAAVFDGYSLKAAVHLERLTRLKGDGTVYPNAAIDEVLSIVGATRRDVDACAYARGLFPARYFRRLGVGRWLREQYRTYVQGKTRRYMLHDMVRHKTTDIGSFFDTAAFQRDAGFRDDAAVYFYNHHEAHALAPLFYSPWNDALIVTADAGGDNVHYSARYLGGGEIKTIHGGDDCATIPPVEGSIGDAYSAATQSLGFRPTRHEGKVTGLAARGEPEAYDRIAAKFSVDSAGQVHSTFPHHDAMLPFFGEIVRQMSRENVSASIQKVLENLMMTSIQRLLAAHPSRHLGLSGGVFANVKLNRLLAEQLPLDELFVFPTMSDEGLSVGGVLAYLLDRDGPARWLDRRQPLGDVYLGRDFGHAIDKVLGATANVRRTAETPVDDAVKRLAAGQIGAIYTNRMEYGPRALGARTILANPSRRETHDLLNVRLDRSEFMPFAPVVAAERADEVFVLNGVNRRACRYMTVACDVRSAWRGKIAAVVHVDGSARPQIVERPSNPLYYDIITGFERATGIPVLVNTSFNVHEEPIVNSPSECSKALVERRIDFVVTDAGIYEHESAT